MRSWLVWSCRLFGLVPLLTVSAVSAASLVDVRGVVRAEVAATLSTELIARITRMPFQVGRSFKAGDVLIAFDCERYNADLRAADADVAAAKITMKQNRQLLELRAGGANDLAISEAKWAQARAVADSLRARLKQCVIRAPFDGRISERLVEIYEMPQANAPLVKLVKTGRYQVDLIVPSNWMTWLQPGEAFLFEIDETSKVHRAEILHLGAVVDPISKTIKVSANLLDTSSAIRPGMSGNAKFSIPNG